MGEACQDLPLISTNSTPAPTCCRGRLHERLLQASVAQSSAFPPQPPFPTTPHLQSWSPSRCPPRLPLAPAIRHRPNQLALRCRPCFSISVPSCSSPPRAICLLNVLGRSRPRCVGHPIAAAQSSQSQRKPRVRRANTTRAKRDIDAVSAPSNPAISPTTDAPRDPRPLNFHRCNPSSPAPYPRKTSPAPVPAQTPPVSVPTAAIDWALPDLSPEHTVQQSYRKRFPSQGSYLEELQQQSPFRLRVNSEASSFYRASSASRLWNPANSTQTFLLQAPPLPRRPSTHVPPPVPIPQLALNVASSVNLAGAVAAVADDHLLSAQGKGQCLVERTSLNTDRAGRGSIRLPRSLRSSFERSRSRGTVTPSPSTILEPEAGPPARRSPSVREAETNSGIEVIRNNAQCESRREQSSSPVWSPGVNGRKSDKGKGKVAMGSTEDSSQKTGASFDRDLEQGPEPHRRDSVGSFDDGIGPAVSSSNSSIMGDPDAEADDEEWGPQHPCFPHLNPHVAINSPEYANTRIIRIKRDWLLKGDLAPTFSNMYPEILDPAGLSEVEFRRVIDKLNTELIAIFNPSNYRNVIDSVMGVMTGWLWDDMGFTYAKARLAALERWIERWNKEMEKTVRTAGGDDNIIPPRIVPLRKTAYMSLDIQIFDPEIQTAQSTARDEFRDYELDMAAESSAAATTAA